MRAEIKLPEEVAMYSAKTAGATTSFSERYYIEQIRKGNIPIMRIGKSVRILRDDLLAFLNSQSKDQIEA